MYGQRRGRFGRQSSVNTPAGYTYVGPCRCGTGPHAFYQDPNGRVVPVRQLCQIGYPTATTKEELKTELEDLKKDKAELDKRIEEIDRRIC
jgi:hypothetical protein